MNYRSQAYRIIYEVHEEGHAVLVIAVLHYVAPAVFQDKKQETDSLSPLAKNS